MSSTNERDLPSVVYYKKPGGFYNEISDDMNNDVPNDVIQREIRDILHNLPDDLYNEILCDQNNDVPDLLYDELTEDVVSSTGNLKKNDKLWSSGNG